MLSKFQFYLVFLDCMFSCPFLCLLKIQWFVVFKFRRLEYVRQGCKTGMHLAKALLARYGRKFHR